MTLPSCCLVSHTLQNGIGPADANLLLADELTKRNHRVSLCGLSDGRRTKVESEIRRIHDQTVNALHIPEAISWQERCDAFRNFLSEHEPDFVIIRFIPYSLNPKGIVWQAANSLPNVLRGRSVLWLVDEIWLGEGPTNWKHRLVGLLQRYSILRLLKATDKRLVFTNNHFNTKALRKRGVNARTLRLFGNIPVVKSDHGEWLFHEFEKAGLPITATNRSQWLVLGIFGVFHPDWSPDSFLSALKDNAAKHGKQVCLVGVGSLRSYEAHWENVSKKWAACFRFLHLGCRDESEVSRFLQSVDFGLTTNPYFLVGKSGTCMAMLDHGLPILVPRITSHDDPAEFPAHLVLRCGDRIGDEVFSPRNAMVPDPQLPRAVDELVAAMSRGEMKSVE